MLSKMQPNMSDNPSNHPAANPSSVGRGIIALLAITLLGTSMAYAGDPEKAAGVMTAMAPKTAQSHMDSIQQGFQQFIHWQMMLRILLGFSLAVGCAWFIAWHPRRSTKADAAADLDPSELEMSLATKIGPDCDIQVRVY